MNYGNLFVSTVFFGTPLLFAALVHGTCLKFDWFRWAKKPLDLKKSFRGKRLFGDNKTWRGLLMACVGCLLGVYILRLLERYWPPFGKEYAFFSYEQVNIFWLGLAFGVGMTLGELPNSFLKRQYDIKPGTQAKGMKGFFFIFLDQVDLLLGLWCLVPFVVSPSQFRDHLFWWACVVSIVFTAIIHFMLTVIGYKLGMRKTIL